MVAPESTKASVCTFLPYTQSVTGILKEVLLLHAILLQDSSTTFVELQYSSDHTPLVVNLQIIKEFVPVIKYTIKKNSNEELAHTTDIINKFKKIDITFLTSKEALEDIVNKFVLTQEHLWLKHSKCVNIIK